VQWVGAVEVMPRQRVLAAIRAIQDPDGIRRRAIVEPNLLPYVLGLVTPDTREGELTSYEPDEIRFTIEAPRDGLVVLNEIMFPGWHVDVDGRSAAPLVANYMLRAVRVGPGHHAVVWRFEPPRWRLYVAGYLIALAIMLGAALAPRRPSARAA
jgi:hypothetical protein